MRPFILIQTLALVLVSLTASATETYQLLEKDVVVIGGGASGVYTGVKLHDADKDVLIIESQPVIGGHANTYTDPHTGTNVSMGVIIFHNTTTVKDWFGRWDVNLIPNDQSVPNTAYVDFQTGKVNKGFEPPSNAAFAAALTGYAQLLSKWPEVQTGFNLTYPVDPDLLLLFGELLAKYNLTDVSYNAFLFAQGYSPLMNLSSIYVMKNFGLPLVSDLATGFLTTASHNTRQLYDVIYEKLPSLFMVSTQVTSVKRNGGNGVQIQVNQNGKYTLINAKKLDSGLPDNTSLDASSPDTEYQIGAVPGPYTFATIDSLNLTSVYYGSPSATTTEDQAKQDILTSLRKYKQNNSIKLTNKPEIVSFYNHAPFNMMVSKEAIEGHFYEKLYALQGQCDTFWNGAAWHVQDSGLLWAFTDSYILPIILASL